MFGYFVMFALVGMGIGWIVKNGLVAFITMAVIGALWGTDHHGWGFVTFVELVIGYVIGLCASNNK